MDRSAQWERHSRISSLAEPARLFLAVSMASSYTARVHKLTEIKRISDLRDVFLAKQRPSSTAVKKSAATWA